MPDEQWQRVENLFHATLALAPGERAAYLSRECGENEPLRLEVESLISAFEVENSFIEQPALSFGIRVLSDGMSGSLVGSSLGHYQITQLLGHGGMGEVYLAEDSVLERRVALKFISSALIDNEWAREQLLKEARAVAKLDHPNICAVYGVEHADGHHFIVMQYVEGETLASVIRRVPLATMRVLEWAEQLTGVLSVAHARGIIHRDIKPQNIMVTPDEQIKVLDFGLAKFTQQMKDLGIQSVGPNTQAGIIAGTAPYMSPEQKRGEELDGRSDIFSFGIVLCDMLGWSNPSQCETDEEMIAAIRGNKLNGLSRKLRADLERIVIRCLRSRRELRYGSADELRRDIQRLRESLLPSPPAFWKRLGAAHYAVASVVLLLILFAGTVLYGKISKTHTLAILPILNASDEQSNAYLSEGLTQTLADKFSYLPRLKVRVSSIKQDKDRKTDPLMVARDLRAEAILTGELIKEGDAFKVRLRLIDTASGSQTWEDTFAINQADLLILQDEITKDVISQLGMWLLGDERTFLSKRQTNNREAFSYYMQGRHIWSLKRDRKNIQEAIRLFERAIDLDPSFAKAYAGLADCYALTTSTLYGPNSTKEAMEKAVWNANKAIELNDSLAEAHASIGLVHLNDWNWQASEKAFKQAIELNPEYAPARYWYSNLLATQKRFDEAIRQCELAKSYDPYSRLAEMNYGRALYYTRRYEEAAAHFSRLLDQEPDYAQYLHVMGIVLAQLGRFDEAIATLEKLHAKDPLHTAAALGYVYGKAGQTENALSVLQELDEFAKTQNVPPLEKALVYIGLDDTDNAFAQLEVCFQQRLAILGYLTTDPIYDGLRHDPRFAELAHRLNLTP